jgi:transposase, IS5 family
MRGKTSQQLSFAEGFLDPSLYELNDELKEIDELLQNRSFLKPFEDTFHESMGRPATVVDTYIRMMYLKFRWGLSYEEVEAEVRERLPWRYFCKLSLMERVPDATTLIKLNQRFGDELITDLNKKLVKYLIKEKKIKSRRIRIDSTTVESHIIYPNDVGLVHSVVRTLTQTAKKLGQKVTNHTRATKRRLAQMGAALKSTSKNKKEQAQKTLRAVVEFAEDTLTQCKTIVKKWSKKVNTLSPTQKKQFEQFTDYVATSERILEQSCQKLQGKPRIPERIVSLYDPEARPIRRGKLKQPNEFGRTAYLAQDESGIIVHYELLEGCPSDRTRALPFVKQMKQRTKTVPKEVAFDKGFYSSENIVNLKSLNIDRVCIPKIGRLTPGERRHQRKPWFKRLRNFRCGVEAAISMLKRRFSFGRPPVRGTPRVASWIGYSILSYNLWQMT